ncbi:cytochrome c oxidase accessory protein CcoG [Phaeovulum vinaykumarii]|uniref:Cytochrome c oxidase accessory protein FixG n=1 Tax=Phaeovulum vinaykumarii TaxID=407234 RepID=A0A1N7KSM4_9RHOB|nr:cytochrome c oxidase accessory protein CcoG [Phaeovulum vinaykumarii]SIS64613.1 cytochrome c oxidase accessory protein FixG [Phaeovulum vinaykumarii]SOC01537.1 cytochrome c oxidase accessory protein FixG [Phaeovulum vinaykumarii]
MSSSDQTPLYAAREPIFPKRISGRFRNLKWVIMAVTLGIYYVLPWLRWDRGPGMPDQAVLVDLANRRFFFFMIEIWPHEFYFVAGLLIMAGLGLFLFTSMAGRVWCGYTCPQTVWTDLFILVERWVEGDRNNRLRLWRQKWSLSKFKLRLIKWALWFLIALFTGGAWIFYFADAPTLLWNLLTGQAPAIAYITMLVLTATTFVFAGFAREQMCIYACPWPRIQAAMMDEDTITIAYREWRGEPRGKHRKAEDADTLGDCIDCMACVNVCPMGIDIRDGQQLECITCALCIDACDEMMDKVGKPRGLIGYMALKDEAAERAGAHPKRIWRHIFRPRTMLYFTLWSGIGIALIVALFLRSPIDVNVTPARDPLFVALSDGAIRNTYSVRLRNKQGEPRVFRLTVMADDPAVQSALAVSLEGQPGNTVAVPADSTLDQRLYIVAEPGSTPATTARSEIKLWVEDTSSTDRAGLETIFNGKGK